MWHLLGSTFLSDQKRARQLDKIHLRQITDLFVKVVLCSQKSVSERSSAAWFSVIFVKCAHHTDFKGWDESIKLFSARIWMQTIQYRNTNIQKHKTHPTQPWTSQRARCRYYRRAGSPVEKREKQWAPTDTCTIQPSKGKCMDVPWRMCRCQRAATLCTSCHRVDTWWCQPRTPLFYKHSVNGKQNLHL